MANKHLAKAIVDIAVFLEFSTEDTLDADAAMGAMEQLAGELQRTGDDERNSLAACFHELAGSYGDKAGFVENFPEFVGLI